MRTLAGGWFTPGDRIAALRGRSGQPAVGPCPLPHPLGHGPTCRVIQLQATAIPPKRTIDATDT